MENAIPRLDFEVTRRCPYNCIHCSVSANMNYKDTITTDKCVNIIKEYIELSGREIIITGGEPILRGYDFFNNIFNICNKSDVKIFLYTSGYNISDTLLELFSNQNNLMVCISLEGNENIHDFISGINGSYSTVINCLNKFKDYGIRCRINFTPMKINYKYLNHVGEILNKYSLQELKIFKFIPQGRGLCNLRQLELNSEDEILLKQIINDMKTRYNIKIGGKIKNINDSCNVNKKIVISSEGNILPCLGLRYLNINIGNIYNSSLKDIIDNYMKMDYKYLCSECGCITSELINYTF